MMGARIIIDGSHNVILTSDTISPDATLVEVFFPGTDSEPSEFWAEWANTMEKHNAKWSPVPRTWMLS